MIDYDGYDKKVKIEGKTLEAFFPDDHTTLKGMVYSYKRWDANRGDSWANIANMKEYIVLHVLWKGHKKWEKIVDGSKNTSNYELCCYPYGSVVPSYNIANVLFQFETKEKQRKCNLEARQKRLENSLKKNRKELKTVKKELLEMEKEN